MHGAVWLICWPGKYATDIAMSLKGAFDQVGAFKKDDFTAFFKDNVFHCLLQKDTVAWIPYGHCSTLISLQGQENDSSDFLLTVPYMSVGLLHKAPSAPRTAFGKIVEECCDTLPSGSKQQQAVSLFLAWFRSSLEEERNEEEDEQDESPQGVTGLIMHAAGSDIVQDTEMANTQAATLEG